MSIFRRGGLGALELGALTFVLALGACGGRSVRELGAAGAAADDSGSSGTGGSGHRGGSTSTGGSSGLVASGGSAASAATSAGGTAPAAGGSAPAAGGSAPAAGGSTPAAGGSAPAAGGSAPAAGGTIGVAGSVGAGGSVMVAPPCDTSGVSFETMCPAGQASIASDPVCDQLLRCVIGVSCAQSGACDACIATATGSLGTSLCVPGSEVPLLGPACTSELTSYGCASQ